MVKVRGQIVKRKPIQFSIIPKDRKKENISRSMIQSQLKLTIKNRYLLLTLPLFIIK